MKLIKQKRNDDCVLCCVAMVAGVSYKKARKAFDDKPHIVSYRNARL